jgi:hypothetical protein
MMSHSVVLNLRLVASFFLIGVQTEGFARGFQCEHQTSGVEPALICSDEGSGTGEHVARVSLRKMPRWGIHAGLTVIDFCLIPRAVAGAVVDDSVKIDSPMNPKAADFVPTGSCERKYCTDVNRLNSFFVNTVPIPIGWTSVSFWLGYRNQSFSVQCQELKEESEIQ